MNPDSLFQVVNNLALVSWIVILLFQRKVWIKPFILGTSITLLAATYTYLLFTSFNLESFESFGSLQGIMLLFQNESAVLAGWVHYVAFDLMVGLYIISNASKYGISPWILIPSLILTFMAGPFGLLTYLLLRIFLTKSHFQY